MKAAVHYETGPPEVLRYEDVPDPTPGPGEVLVEVEAISIEGGDTLNRLGGEMVTTPHVVGYQCAGTVRAVGDAVTDRAPGDRVVCTSTHGSHAELIAVPALLTWPIPDGLDVLEAATVPVPWGTADDCLFELGRLEPGETVLIQAAAGGVGIAAIQLAHRAGATVLAVVGGAERGARLRDLDLGCDHVLDHRAVDVAVAARDLTGGRGVDLVVDPVGSTLPTSLATLAHRGRCLLVGQAGRDPRPIDASLLMAGNQSLTGVFLGAEIATPRVRDVIARHLDDVAAGRSRVVIDRVFPLAEAAEAHAYVESRAAVGRVVMVP